MKTQENLSRLFAAVKDMRRLQRTWFGGDKSQETLQASKKAERLVDQILRDIDEPPPTQTGFL